MAIAMPKTAMVLAAGLGTRMLPLTQATAKPLIEVSGKALIDRSLDPLVAAGVERVVVNVHWCADAVEAHVTARTDIEVLISDERAAPLETGGGLAKAAPLLGEDPIFVVNTDAFWASGTPAPLHALADGFDPARMEARLLIADTGRALGFPGPGDFFMHDDGTMMRRGTAQQAPWAYAGVRLIKPGRYRREPAEPFSALRIWDEYITERRLTGEALDDFWLHVGTPDSLADAEMWLRCHGA